MILPAACALQWDGVRFGTGWFDTVTLDSTGLGKWWCVLRAENLCWAGSSHAVSKQFTRKTA